MNPKSRSQKLGARSRKPEAGSHGKNGRARLADFRPQRQNINLGKPHGLAALDKSIRRDGYSAPMVAAADGEVFAGSKRLERVADIMPEAAPIVVHSDGTRPVIHVRDDIPTADDPRAKRLGVADNLISAMDWNPDGALLAALAAEDSAIAELARQESASLKALAEYRLSQPEETPSEHSFKEQYLIIVTCRDEAHQVELLEHFQQEGLACRALLS